MATPSSPSHARLRRITPHRILILILLGHLLLALGYSLIIPPWEAHDEWAHYRYAAYIAETGHLPDPGQRLTTEFQFDEASQPPLYYLLASLPMLLVDTQDGYTPEVNPYLSGQSAQTGLNVAIHDPQTEAFPWQGTILALHLGRFISILISLLALLVTWRLTTYLTPHRPDIALTATAIQAFAPQFVFLSAVITNDILLTFLTPLLIYLSLRLIQEGPRPRLTTAASLVAGLTLLTKYLALAVIPLAILAFLWGAWRHRRSPHIRRQLGLSLLIFLGILILLGGALFWRNYQYTGRWIPRDPVSQQSIITGLGGGDLNIAWDLLPQALRNGFMTYWVSFGWGNIAPSDGVYLIWLGLILIGLTGILIWIRRDAQPRDRRNILFLALFILAAVSFPLLRELLHHSPFLRGRYMLATLPVAAWTLALGWAALLPTLWRWTRWLLIAWPLGLSLVLPFTLLRPAYAPPSSFQGDLSPQAIPVHARFGDAAELLAVEIWPAEEVQVHQGLAVTLTWRVLQRTPKPYTLSIQVVGMADRGYNYANLQTYPGHGNAATSVWEPGLTFQETYWLIVRPERPVPTSAQIQITLYRPQGDPAYLPVFDSQGNPLGNSLRVGSFRISPDAQTSPPALASHPLATFAPYLLIRETHVETTPQHPGGAFPIWIAWQALGPGPDDLALSLQLLDSQGQWVAGRDGPISTILLPSHWRQGDLLDTTRWFPLPADLPPGHYQLMATLYHTSDLTRVPGTDAQGHPLPNHLYPITDIQVTAP